MAATNDHMEYSMWHDIVTTWSTPWGCKNKVLWSSLYFFNNKHSLQRYEELHMALDFCHMEYSIWHHKTAIWSTPYDNMI